MPVSVRKSTSQKTVASKRKQQDIKQLSDLRRKEKQQKARLCHIPGPVRLARGLGSPPPLKLPTLEKVYLDNESLKATIYSLERNLRGLRYELIKIKSKVVTLERDNKHLVDQVRDLTGRSPIYYPTSPAYSFAPEFESFTPCNQDN